MDETLARAAEASLRVEILDVGRDVDDATDLAWLEDELRRGGRAEIDLVPRTARVLESMGRL